MNRKTRLPKMRALTKDEIEVLRWALHERYGIDRRKLFGIKRRLVNLGLIRVDIPRMPGWQDTQYEYTSKGSAVVREFDELQVVTNKIRKLRELITNLPGR